MCSATGRSMASWAPFIRTWSLLCCPNFGPILLAAGVTRDILRCLNAPTRYVYIALISLALVCHFRTANADPGTVPKNAEPLEDNGKESRFVYRECRYCEAYRPSRAHHCSFCDACIIKLDHHCPWTGQCIGIGNHKYFLLFVGYTTVACTYPLLLIVYRFAACRWGFTWEDDQFCAGHGRFWVYVLVVAAILMFMFTSCIVVDQIDSIRYTRTAMAALPAKDKDRHTAASSNLREIFGSTGGFTAGWLLPTAPSFSSDDWERIVGYSTPTSAESPDEEMGAESMTMRGAQRV